MSILRARGRIPPTTKLGFADPYGTQVSETIADTQSTDERSLQGDVRATIAELEHLPCKWNGMIMFLLRSSGWDFVSSLLVEAYQSMGRRVLREYIDVPSLIRDMSRSDELIGYISEYKAAGMKYAVEIIDVAVDSMIAGFISRYQFMAIVAHLTSRESVFLRVEKTPSDIGVRLMDRILTTATLSKSRYQAEFYSMVSLIAYDSPWIKGRDSYLVFSGKRAPVLKRKRVGGWMEEEIAGTPPKRQCVNGYDIDEYFSDSLPSTDVLSEESLIDHDPLVEIQI